MPTGSVGSFFGPGVVKTYERGKLVSSDVGEAQSRNVEIPDAMFVCWCKKKFSHAPAFLIHKKFCPRAILHSLEGDDEEVDPEMDTTAVVTQHLDDSSTGAGDSEQLSCASISPAHKKLCKDGRPKQSGLCEGHIPYT
jgi:hypothetical protein